MSPESDGARLRAVTDAMLDPQILFEPVRDAAGRITDFTYAAVNAAACAYLGVDHEDLIGRSLVETFPNLEESGLLAHYVHCAETGEPVQRDDFIFDVGPLGTTRRFDIRGARGRDGAIGVSYRDVTDRYDTVRRYRLLAENAADVVFSFDRDGRIVWMSPSVQQALGAPADYWIGREVRETLHPEELRPVTRLSTVLAGGVVRERVRVVGADGVVHWTHVLAKPTYDDDGYIDGGQASLRLIDHEVAAEEALEQARRRQALADELHRRSMESAAVGMCLARPDGALLRVNEAMCEFFGYDEQTLLQKTWMELTAEDDLQADLDKVADLVAGRIDFYRIVKRYIHADGHLLWGDLSVGVVRRADGSVEVGIGQIVDITAQVEADERNRVLTQELQRQNELIAASEHHYRMLAENAGDVVAHFREGRVVWASPSVEAVLGAPPEYWLGRSVLEFVPEEDVPVNLVRLARLAKGDTIAEHLRVIGADGVTHWVSLHAKPFHDAEGRPDGEAVTLRLADGEVAAEQALEEARRRQAKTDERYRRSMDHAAVGMCLITPDGRFEEVNDALCQLFGYDAETLMQKTWQELTAPEYLEADLQNVNDILEGRIDSYRMLKQYIHANGQRIWGDLSVGCIRDEHGHVDTFISQITDVTLVEHALRERLEFEEFISQAINHGRLVVFAQPIVDARTGRLVEEELLVRMVGSGGELIAPGGFLPQAQRFGLMPAIDRFMVARGVELALAGRRVAVNLSAASIGDQETMEIITEELRQAGDAAARVSFEITESTALTSMEIAQRFSNELRVLGCRLALDDFGTGYGTFTELRGLALHTLKIDQSFVRQMVADKRDESVVRLIIGIATEFGLLTTAEGVEDAETRTRLVELGVDQLQGYLIGRPAPAKP